jgi:hypothetical protein
VTTPGGGEPVEDTVHFAANTKDLVKARFLEAVVDGSGQRFLTALRAVVERLQRDPHAFGEPLYRLPALKLLVYHGVLAPLVVDYGVHEEQPLVFIRGVRVLS